ncbi:sodium bile acid symporter family-domain-containing protein [Polychytrium aggregatum]|uniref:sodium bile acid symporter family-domain-containing protein n=1 Tax=Polychytrium aggregatum TaxID=110093 RepID=UPI0022FF0E3A|nr:sodium bile acid symporter family-domain-containing protein [Polychytrium aggregatum]KAI9207251.1 sodium bile acid symporter family-domain-containing protein [Polychytrium aggregatum]
MSGSKKSLSWLNKLLPLWILIAMVTGILLGKFVPSVQAAFNQSTIVDVSVPIAVGLLWMMYPVLCKVRYEELPQLFKSQHAVKTITTSLLVNWIFCPFVMTAFAWATLPDLPGFREGIVLVGVARCIAMVLIWNELSGGDTEWCAIIVAVNSILQVLIFSPAAYFFCVIVGGGSNISIDLWLVTRSVLVFLGIPLLAGIVTRFSLRPTLGSKWYDEKFLPVIGPTSLLGLLYTIVVMFSLQGNRIIDDFGSVARVAVPLVLYFGTVFTATFALCALQRVPYELAATQSFTAAGNNFELAIAIAIATYGVNSQQALSTVIGPLIEVPILLGLVHLSLFIKDRYESVRQRRAKNGDLEGQAASGQSVLVSDLTHLEDTVNIMPNDEKASSGSSVIFVCRMNSCRSQMAEGWLKTLRMKAPAGTIGRVESAGLIGQSRVHPVAIKVMKDRDIDLSSQFSKGIDRFSPSDFDIVISMCGCGASVPEEWKIGKRFEDWNLEDPDEQPEEKFVEVSEQIHERCQELIASISEGRAPTYSLYSEADGCAYRPRPKNT